MKVKILLVLIAITTSMLYGTIINVPLDQSTIQAGINIAVNSDTVLVEAGTYFENINYNGKNITVASFYLTTQDTSYISQTIINGNQNGSVVTFENSEDSTSVLIGFNIINGSAGEGGGIYCNNSSPSLSDLIITNNWGNGSGGAICCKTYSNPTIVNVIIKANSAVSGGGVSCIDNSNPTLRNVLIANNDSNSAGGGIVCRYSDPVLINVSIVSNLDGGGVGGGIFLAFSSNITAINSIIWNNEPNEIEFRPYNEPNSITISYSDIQGGESGIVTNNNGTVNWMEGNIDADPLFVDPGSGDYHLTENSPCIDVGDPTSPLDPDGTIADMGAFYYHQGLLANFEADVISGLVPLEVQFTDLSTPPDSTISWQWDFENDGIIDSYLQNPIYTYNEGGIYTVSLTVSDGTNEDTEIKEDYINVDQPIVVTELIPPEGNITIDEGDVINFSIDAFDPDGNELEYYWSVNNMAVSDSSSFDFITDENSAGEFEISLFVTDNFGSRNELNFLWNITVNDVVGSGEILIPTITKLYQNYPNPFNPTTTIKFCIQNDSVVELTIYNIKGQKIKTLANNAFTKGLHSINWDGDEDSGKTISSGIYLYKLKVNGKTQAVQKCLLLK